MCKLRQLDEFNRLVDTLAERVPRTEAALVEAPWPGEREPESQRASKSAFERVSRRVGRPRFRYVYIWCTYFARSATRTC